MRYLWILPLLFCTTLKAQQQEIRFGNNGKIIYHLDNGKYDIWEGKQLLMKDVYVSFDGSNADTANITRTTSNKNKNEWSFTYSKNGLAYTQIFLPQTNGFLTRLVIEGDGAKASRMLPLATDAMLAHFSSLVQMPFDNDAWIKYNALQLSANPVTSAEVTALFDPTGKSGLIIGSVEHTNWKTGVEVADGKLAVIAGYTDSTITRDKKDHGVVTEKNIRCASPLILVLPAKNWQQGLEQYADANIKAEPRYIGRWNKAKPVGWNSWGSIQTKLSLENAKKVADFFADSCKTFRDADNTMFIDLDSYWDNLSKGGMSGDFGQLAEFSNYCKSKGLKPGIYWAPFVDWGKYPRKVEGSSDNYEDVWTKVNGRYCDLDGGRAMDPTHPATRARIAYLIERFKAAGFEMIKIDFLGHAAIEGDRFYDPEVKTGMQAFRKGMEWLNDQLDNKMLVYAAISPNLATARYTHMRRIACDAFSGISETAYTLNGTSYGWWLNRMYDYLDADHVVLHGVGENVNRARLTSSLVTGTLVLGDDFAGLSTKAALLQNKAFLKLAKEGKWQPLDQETGKTACNIFYKPGAIALINYGKDEMVVDLEKYLPKKVSKLAAVFHGTEISKSNNLHVKAEDAVILTW